MLRGAQYMDKAAYKETVSNKLSREFNQWSIKQWARWYREYIEQDEDGGHQTSLEEVEDYASTKE